MTDEQYNIMKQARPHFESAKHNAIRNCPRWLSEQVMQTWEDITGKTWHSKSLSCATCVLHLIQAAGKLFYEEEQKRQIVENEKVTKAANGKSKSGKRKKDNRDTDTSEERVVKS